VRLPPRRVVMKQLGYTKAHVTAMLQLVDADADHRVSFEEFINAHSYFIEIPKSVSATARLVRAPKRGLAWGAL
jgi:Ca2+-binding EF-hand superfamily protein